MNEKLNILNNEKISTYIFSLEYDGNCMHNHCDSCKENCHHYCDCLGNSFGRCRFFTIYSQSCEYCGCSKEKHKIDHYHWVKKLVYKKKDNAQLIQEEKNRIEREKKNVEERNRKKIEQINELNYNKNILIKEKEKNIKEENEIKKKIENIKKQIISIIMKLQNLSNKLFYGAKKNVHLKNENYNIDSLLDEKRKIELNMENK